MGKRTFMSREGLGCMIIGDLSRGPFQASNCEIRDMPTKRALAALDMPESEDALFYPEGWVPNLDLASLMRILPIASWVEGEMGRGPGGREGAWVDLGRDQFACRRCGKCCALPDAFATMADERDVRRWRREGRRDIFALLMPLCYGLYDLWLDPRTNDEATKRCPWFRKSRKTGQCACAIHETKPRHCDAFPLTKRHAIACGCPGWALDTLVPGEWHALVAPPLA